MAAAAAAVEERARVAAAAAAVEERARVASLLLCTYDRALLAATTAGNKECCARLCALEAVSIERMRWPSRRVRLTSPLHALCDTCLDSPYYAVGLKGDAPAVSGGFFVNAL